MTISVNAGKLYSKFDARVRVGEVITTSGKDYDVAIAHDEDKDFIELEVLHVHSPKADIHKLRAGSKEAVRIPFETWRLLNRICKTLQPIV